MAVKLVWSLTHFQAGFQSQSSQGCNTEQKQDSVTHNVYSQQGGARSAAGQALGCGKEIAWKSLNSCPQQQAKTNQAHTHTVHTHPQRLGVINTGNAV